TAVPDGSAKLTARPASEPAGPEIEIAAQYPSCQRLWIVTVAIRWSGRVGGWLTAGAVVVVGLVVLVVLVVDGVVVPRSGCVLGGDGAVPVDGEAGPVYVIG